ncbi:MAG TPA: 50S ribosomal protein L10 [Terriglobia bacterium]|nr:50S ribosomal protein L10 [Terriglobia bacterium]
MNKDEKAKEVEKVRGDIQRAKSVVLTSFEGITVAQDFDLRRRVAQSGGRYRVLKNSLIERAAQGTPVEAAVSPKLRGTTSLATTESDPVALAKVLTTYAKENPILVFKAGVVEGRVVSLADLMALASLPSREALLAKALFLLNAPGTRLASTLAGVARNLAFVIKQAVDEKKFAENS